MKNHSNHSEEPTMRDYLRVIFRQKAVILVCLFSVMMTVYIGLKMNTPVYEAEVKMLISAEKQIDSPYYKQMTGYRDIKASLTQSEIVKSNPVIERTVRALNLHLRPLDYEKKYASELKVMFMDFKDKMFNEKIISLNTEENDALRLSKVVDGLKNNVKVEPIRDTNLFTIRVKDFDRTEAAKIVNTISRSYVIFDLEQQLAEVKLKYGDKHPTVLQLSNSIEQMTKHLTGGTLSNLDAIGPASVKIIEQAALPLKVKGAHKGIVLLLAFLMSGSLGLLLAFVFDYVDQSIKTPQDIAQYLDIACLGSIERTYGGRNGLILNSSRKSKYYKTYRAVSDQICLLFKNNQQRSLLMTSALVNEGSSRVTANVGFYLANELQHKVLIIDANLRERFMSRLLKLNGNPGLAVYLEGKATSKEIIQKVGSGLDVISAGSTELNPVTLLESTKMKELIEVVTNKYEIVLIDCADLKGYKDATILSKIADGIALTVSEGQTRRQVLQNACSELRQNNGNILGVILNNRMFSIPNMIYKNV